jgi:L-rhamnose isomerase
MRSTLKVKPQRNGEDMFRRDFTMTRMAITKQQAYDFFFASLAEEIIAAEDTLAGVDRDDSAYSGLQDCATNLQRLLSALDDIYHALPDERTYLSQRSR